MRLIKNGNVVFNDSVAKADILIDEGKIVDIQDELNVENVEVLNVDGLYVLPGLIDVHVHLREPGYTHKETIRTGTMAAVKGGFTTICPMPNVIPYPDNVETVKEYLKLIDENAVNNVYPYATMTKAEKGLEVVDIKEIKKLGIEIFSDDGVGVKDDAIMQEIFNQAKENDVMIVAHTEDMNYRPKGASVHLGSYTNQLGYIGIDSKCESEALKRDLDIMLKGNKYHACHISAKESVEYLREAKKKGLDVSGEVTAHHLILEDKDVKGTNFKMNPPLRSHEDRMALIKGLEDETLDFIASDHAPHTEEEKSKSMEEAPFGIVSLETSFPLLYTEFVKNEKRWSLNDLVKYMSFKPAKRFNFINKGEIAVGKDADLTIVDLEHQFTIDKNEFVSMGHNTPFDKWKVYGKIKETIVGGKTVWKG